LIRDLSVIQVQQISDALDHHLERILGPDVRGACTYAYDVDGNITLLCLFWIQWTQSASSVENERTLSVTPKVWQDRKEIMQKEGVSYQQSAGIPSGVRGFFARSVLGIIEKFDVTNLKPTSFQELIDLLHVLYDACEETKFIGHWQDSVFSIETDWHEV